MTAASPQPLLDRDTGRQLVNNVSEQVDSQARVAGRSTGLQVNDADTLILSCCMRMIRRARSAATLRARQDVRVLRRRHLENSIFQRSSVVLTGCECNLTTTIKTAYPV